MKTILLFVVSLTCFGLSFAQNTVELSDLRLLDGTSWSGNLMYVNYGDGREVTLPSTMQIKLEGNAVIMSTQYTDEPNANTEDKIKLKKGGTYFGDEKIVKKIREKDGTLVITTKFSGSDANRAATIFKTYRFNEKEFSTTKTIEFEGSEEKLIRNRYTYTKL